LLVVFLYFFFCLGSLSLGPNGKIPFLRMSILTQIEVLALFHAGQQAAAV